MKGFRRLIKRNGWIIVGNLLDNSDRIFLRRQEMNIILVGAGLKPFPALIQEY